MAWYVSRVFVPVGLSPYHPAHAEVSWSDPGFWPALGLLAAVAAIVALVARRSRLTWACLLWFAAAIFATLPLTPARNVFVAERYAYLPHIGLYWLLAAGLAWVGRRWLNAPFRIAMAVCIALVLTVISWRTCACYDDDVARSARMLAVYPDHPDVAVKHAWSLYYAGRYGDAIASATAALELQGAFAMSPTDRADAYQAIGLAQWRLGHLDDALNTLEEALSVIPDNGPAWARYARVLRAAGHADQALAALERCAQRQPNYNPGLLELANAYVRANRPADARRAFQQALENNPYEASATLGLAELDMQAGQPANALDHLLALLAWMPDNVPARINAGVCLAALGKTAEAAEQYAAALALDPDATAAVMNLAGLLAAEGDLAAATQHLDAYLDQRPTDRAPLLLAVELHVRANEHRQAAMLLTVALKTDGASAELHGWYAWVSWLAQQWSAAADAAQAALKIDPEQSRAQMVQCGVLLRQQAHANAVRFVEDIIARDVLADVQAFDAFAAVLQTHASAAPDDPWPYYLLARACQATGRAEALTWAVEECLRRAQDADLRTQAEALRTRPDSPEPAVP